MLSLLISCSSDNPAAQHNAGDPFPLEKLKALVRNGDKPPSFENKTLVINFWASWCTPCRKEMPELQRLSNSLDPEKFLVIAVSVDDDKNMMQEFLFQQQIDLLNYHDSGQYMSRNIFNIKAYPETFIISPKGLIVRRITGEQLWNSPSMHSWLESIQRGDTFTHNGWAFS